MMLRDKHYILWCFILPIREIVCLWTMEKKGKKCYNIFLT